MARKVSPKDLLDILGAGGEIERLPSSLEKAINGLREDIRADMNQRSSEASELKTLLVSAIEKMTPKDHADINIAVEKMAKLFAHDDRPAYTFKIDRDRNGKITSMNAEPNTKRIN